MEKPNWAILVYIAADDVLSDFAVGSLRKLRRLASQDTGIVVAAQFDANGKQDISRLIFQGKEDSEKSIHDSKVDQIAPIDMAHPEAVRKFINWAYDQCQADHYCLVLWGHGPELLTSDHPDLPDGKKPKKFLTPADVSRALANTTLIQQGRKFDIVAIDACNMSMIEMARELQGYAEFLVASEEEVPDFSFPYDRLLELGSAQNRDEIVKVCQKMPGRYIDAYRDYTLTKATLTDSISLSSLSLKDVKTVIEPLGQLASAFLKADKTIGQAVINARANARDFVFGLYVDLYDFCERLSEELLLRNIALDLRLACDRMCAAVRPHGEGSFVMANAVSRDQRCHGVSIYFPYLTGFEKSPMDRGLENDRQEEGARKGLEWQGTEALDRGMGLRDRGTSAPAIAQAATTLTSGEPEFLTRGGTGVPSKGGTGVPSKGGTGVPSKMRRQRIEETEQYYANLEFSRETHWDKFIRHRWSRWLVEEVETRLNASPDTAISETLNCQYSAQQCALNLLSLCRELEAGSDSAGAQTGCGQPMNSAPKGPFPGNGASYR